MTLGINSKYRVGFITQHPNDGYKYIASCSCGVIDLIKLNNNMEKRNLDLGNHTCSKCENKKFKSLTSSKRGTLPYLTLLKGDRTGFEIERTSVSVFYDEYFNVKIKENSVKTLTHNMGTGELKMENVDRVGNVDVKTQGLYNFDVAMRTFFTGIEDDDFIKVISTPETAELYKFIYSKLSYAKNSTWGDRRLWRGLVKFKAENYTYMEILANAGFTNLDRFYERSSYNRIINREGTNPRDILGLPKYAVGYVRQDDAMSTYDIRQLQTATRKLEPNKFREVMEIVKDESTIRQLCGTIDYLDEINNKYGYTNLKKLALYLFREIRITQGIANPNDGGHFLRDYLKMSKELGLEAEKYPKSLKKEHDLVSINYKVQKNEIKRKKFAETIESEDYKSLSMKSKELSIITPKEMDDIIREGNELSHCVASYVDSVIEGNCKILFLRNTDDLNTPLATVEVRGNNIRQARGSHNRQLGNREREFIQTWADKKNLTVNYYY